MPDDFKSQIKEDVLFKDLTTVALGGPAKQYIEVKSPDQLLKLLQVVHSQNIPYLLIGGGSNLLVSDEGVDKLVIHNRVMGIKQDQDTIKVESGTPLQLLINFTLTHGLSGIHKMTGIPGTVGGAIYGNAGAYGQTISDHLVSVDCFDPDSIGVDGQKVITLSKKDCQFGYRDSIFKDNHFVILAAHFKFEPAQSQTLQDESSKILEKRLNSYSPGLKCPGSFFKNVLAENLPPEILQKIPPEKITFGKIPAGYLLETVEAKGQKLGDIKISENHGNLFMNIGEGTTHDFYQLAKTYAGKVKEKFGIILEPEVQLINLPPLSSDSE